MKKIVFCLCFLLAFVGCAQKKVKTEFIEKPIPIKCVEVVPEKPKYSSDVWEFLENTLIYLEQLEVIVKNCSEKSVK